MRLINIKSFYRIISIVYIVCILREAYQLFDQIGNLVKNNTLICISFIYNNINVLNSFYLFSQFFF